MQDVLATAIHWHRSGLPDVAAQLCRQVLAQSPDDPDALHLLGIIHQQRGEHARAAEMLGRAVVLRPGDAPAHNHLAGALRQLGRADEALTHFRRAAELAPATPSCGATSGKCF
jgi:Flp pilus assembly protein TadD